MSGPTISGKPSEQGLEWLVCVLAGALGMVVLAPVLYVLLAENQIALSNGWRRGGSKGLLVNAALTTANMALVGALTAAAQWFVLQDHVEKTRRWLVVSTLLLGLLPIACMDSVLLAFLRFPVWLLVLLVGLPLSGLVVGACFGALFGGIQAHALREQARLDDRWFIVSMLSWALTGLVVSWALT